MLNGLTHGPLPTPGFLPPFQPNPSEVGDGRAGGRGRVTPLPLGGNGGGRGRVIRLPLGANAGGGDRGALSLGASARLLDEGARALAPAPGFIPKSWPTLAQVGEGLGEFDGDRAPEGGYLAMLESTEVLPQAWDGESITYESVPLISYTPRTFVIDVCVHIKGYMLMQKKLDLFTNF